MTRHVIERRIDREKIAYAQEIVGVLAISGSGLLRGGKTVPVVIVNLQSKTARPTRHGAADPAHAKNAETPTADFLSQQECGRAANRGPATFAYQRLPFVRAARNSTAGGNSLVKRIR